MKFMTASSDYFPPHPQMVTAGGRPSLNPGLLGGGGVFLLKQRSLFDTFSRCLLRDDCHSSLGASLWCCGIFALVNLFTSSS